MREILGDYPCRRHRALIGLFDFYSRALSIIAHTCRTEKKNSLSNFLKRVIFFNRKNSHLVSRKKLSLVKSSF